MIAFEYITKIVLIIAIALLLGSLYIFIYAKPFTDIIPKSTKLIITSMHIFLIFIVLFNLIIKDVVLRAVLTAALVPPYFLTVYFIFKKYEPKKFEEVKQIMHPEEKI